MSKKGTIITTSILVVVLAMIGWGCYYSYLHFTGQTAAQKESYKRAMEASEQQSKAMKENHQFYDDLMNE